MSLIVERETVITSLETMGALSTTKVSNPITELIAISKAGEFLVGFIDEMKKLGEVLHKRTRFVDAVFEIDNHRVRITIKSL